ncbi:hypothetical protein MHU86_13092 [Fragilaria crotonensis]|nr:hypothetical protein MHU86_13092 [Fragilaria crotonensis]
MTRVIRMRVLALSLTVWIYRSSRRQEVIIFLSISGEHEHASDLRSNDVVPAEESRSVQAGVSDVVEVTNDNGDFESVQVEQISEKFFGSPSSKLISIGDCECHLVSIDCLDAIRCLLGDSRKRLRRVYAGVLTRSVLKESSTIAMHMGEIARDVPLGKIFQSIVTDVWQIWLSTNTIPQGLGNAPDAFVNHERYPFCRDNDLLGRYCFINDFSAEEEFGEVEHEAVAKFGHKSHASQEKKTRLKLESLQRNPFTATSLDYLLTFAHIVRITLNFRSHVLDLYRNHTITVDNIKTKNNSSMHETRTPSVLRSMYAVEMHVSTRKVATKQVPPSQLKGTNGGNQALLRYADFVDLYQSVSWKYLQYSRDIFDYFRKKKEDDGDNYIESPNNKFRAVLGETAIADLWHLSHGEAFIGHLGSRFGKLGWFLATARYNSFIPFFTVDGHSVCCDIDEACGENAEHIVSMENCMGKFWAASSYTSNIDPAIYFSTGAYFRKAAAMDELKFRDAKGV